MPPHGVLDNRVVHLKGSRGTIDDVVVGIGDESWKMDKSHSWMAGAHIGAFEMNSFLR